MMSFVRSRLNMRCTVASLHFPAFARGGVIAGSAVPRLFARIGRKAALWGGLAGMTPEFRWLRSVRREPARSPGRSRWDCQARRVSSQIRRSSPIFTARTARLHWRSRTWRRARPQSRRRWRSALLKQSASPGAADCWCRFRQSSFCPSSLGERGFRGRITMCASNAKHPICRADCVFSSR